MLASAQTSFGVRSSRIHFYECVMNEPQRTLRGGYLWASPEGTSVTQWNGCLVDRTEGCSNNRKILHTEQLRENHSVNIHPSLCFSSWIIMSFTLGASLRADVLWGSFVTHSFLWMRDERTPEDVCGEATLVPARRVLPYKGLLGMCRWMTTLQVKFFLWWPTL